MMDHDALPTSGAIEGWTVPDGSASARPRGPGTFSDPLVTATGERRAVVALDALRTLWLNTGTVCNIACTGCYIESSPSNDRLAFLGRAEAAEFLNEARLDHPDLVEIGLTGGEPFANRDTMGIIEDALGWGLRVLVLTNAMRPMQRHEAALLRLLEDHGDRLALRVSLDHFTQARHEQVRGDGSWAPAMAGLRFLARHGFNLAVAGRLMWAEDEPALRAGYARLFASEGIGIDAESRAELVLFPEMGARASVPEITESCWGILGKSPSEVMCASARMVIKRRGAERPAVVACTLLPYDPQFELGATLAEAARSVPLNHRLCAEFCVLGGASCSP